MHKTALSTRKRWLEPKADHLPLSSIQVLVCVCVWSHNSTPTNAFMASTEITLCLQVTMCFYTNYKDMMEWLCSSDGADQITWDY
jgi:hypothetical protein